MQEKRTFMCSHCEFRFEFPADDEAQGGHDVPGDGLHLPVQFEDRDVGVDELDLMGARALDHDVFPAEAASGAGVGHLEPRRPQVEPGEVNVFDRAGPGQGPVEVKDTPCNSTREVLPSGFLQGRT